MSVSSQTTEVAGLVDHLFRRESGRLVSILTRYFGVSHLQLAEDVVQDALLKAMQTWPFIGIPKNPSAWLLQTAKNRGLDQVRRGTRWKGRQAELSPLIEDCLNAALTTPAPQFEDEIADSQLRMMFICCHPDLPPDAQVALTLKTLCGFSEREIAAAFLISEAAVTKRLVRARRFLRDQQVAIELPLATELTPRVEHVLQALYLLFNEGYKATEGDSLLREDLCDEAIRLAGMLSTHVIGDRPTTHALLALMHFGAARLSSRLDEGGGLLILAEQDRANWDQTKIARGMRYLQHSGEGPALALFDQLLQLDDSPLVALNRAVAVAHAQGATAGLEALRAISQIDQLSGYYLYHAVEGQLLLELDRKQEAAVCFRRGWELAKLRPERLLLEEKLRHCTA